MKGSSQRHDHGVANHLGTLEDRRFAPESGLSGCRNPSENDGPASRNSHDVREAATGTVRSGPLAGLTAQPLSDRYAAGVYFIERDGLVKIGETYNIDQRRRAFGMKRSRLLAFGAAEWRRNAEWRIHDQFRRFHVGHEWFRPSEELADLIREIQRTGQIPERFDGQMNYSARPARLMNGTRRKAMRGVHWTHRRSLDRATRFLIAAALAHRAVTICADPSGHSAPTAGGAR